jgi:hypothetical protein
LPDVEGPEGSNISRVLESRRKSLPIVHRQGHEQVELLFQIGSLHCEPARTRWFTLPEEIPKVKMSDSFEGEPVPARY